MIPNVHGDKPDVVESLHIDDPSQLGQTLKQIEEKAAVDPNRNPNKFSQYGQWDNENGQKPNFTNSIYTVEHTNENKKVVASKREGDQEESCQNHLLVGHGVHISNVRNIFNFFLVQG